ncbi:hypothetical protein JAAARDRAFT_201378 [Jaapia argillacea MUCL 33604]|uniref:Uncharacterized protein n=1 Tax=Jaapia argillacea MUCL 33604 TaxID=933084 RepID=A0A067PCZ6_9AGAM|nr:hypothetical protein JAAARDRAFT_201378 [Jaapia argillacea MUCL 33604]
MPFKLISTGGSSSLIAQIWDGVGTALREATSWHGIPECGETPSAYALNYALTRLQYAKEKENTDIDWAIWSIAAAVLNPQYVDWDPQHYAKRSLGSAVDDFFPLANLGKIEIPATFVARHGEIIGWALPGILSQEHVEWFNSASKDLRGPLRESRQKGSGRNSPNLFDLSDRNQFEPGSANFSPGWHQQKLGDPLLPSAHMHKPDVQAVFSTLHRSEILVNAIYAVTQPKHYEGAKVSRPMSKTTTR